MKKYTHLSHEERTLISTYYDRGVSIGEIGRRLDRNKSTILRELRRNSEKDQYKPLTAKKRYLSRRQKPQKLDKNS